MSHKATAWAFEQTPASPVEKFVLICIADCHNAHTGQCNPSVGRLGRITGYSKSTVIRALESLEQQGFLASRKVAGKSTSYSLSFQVGELVDIGRRVVGGDVSRETGVRVTPVETQQSAPSPAVTGVRATPVSALDRAAPNASTGVTEEPVSERHRYQSDTELVSERHRTGVTVTPEPGKNLEENREDEEEGLVRVGDGWLVTPSWRPSEAARARARAAGVPQALIDDVGVLEDFRLKYSEAAQRDRAFGKRWVRWLVNESRNPTPRALPGSVAGESPRSRLAALSARYGNLPASEIPA